MKCKANRRLVPLTVAELLLVTDALTGYANFLESALFATHYDLTKRGRQRRHDERTRSATLRGEIFRRWEAAGKEPR